MNTIVSKGFAACSRPSVRARLPRGGSHVCHVTNLGEEKPALETRIVNVPLLKRNGRPLYLDVETDVFDGLGDDSISQSDMDYWFTADAEELATEYLEPAQVVANTQFTVRNYTLGNNSYESLREGDIVTGEVVAMHLLHGAVVDLGCNFDGLVPVTPGQWEKIQDDHPGCLVLESIVKARVHKIRDPDIFRFPVQLEVLDPTLAAELCAPDEWRCPVEIRPDTDMQKLLALSQPDYQVKILDEVDTQVEKDPVLAASRDTIAFNEMYSATAEKPAEAPAEGEDRPMDNFMFEAGQAFAMF